MTPLAETRQRVAHLLAPPLDLTVSEWADRFRFLSPESAAEPGKWKTLSFQREPMDCCSDIRVRRVVIKSATQMLKTATIENAIGYFAHQDPGPILEQIRGYLETDYDYASALGTVRADLAKASAELLEGLEGAERDELAAANAINLRMAPLTPDHHFYIDQGANARLRVVLVTLGQRLVDEGLLDAADDVLFLRYNELRAFVGNPAAVDARALVAQRRAEREAAGRRQPRDWVGTVTESQLNFPYWVNWGYPERFHRQESQGGSSPDTRQVAGIAGSPGVVEGTARVVRTVADFDEVAEGDILVCQMTNPAWVVLFTKIAGLVTDTGGTTSHPAVLAREFGIPAVVGTSEATRRISTGDRIRVDGTAGVVEIVSAGEPAAAALSLD